MGQKLSGVNYLLIGGGRAARHVAHYFSFLDVPFTQWNRNQREGVLPALAADATHILVLVKDDFIEEVAAKAPSNTAIKIHFSGSVNLPGVYGAHPLMTFNNNLYAPPMYCDIPFVIDDDAPDFAELLPGLPNPHVRLRREQKAKYHAMCVMAGNFSCLLWQKMFDTFQQEFNIPPETAQMYLRQQTQNLLDDYKHALTGPLARGDDKTIERNLKALEGDPYHGVYQSFVKAYRENHNNDDEHI